MKGRKLYTLLAAIIFFSACSSKRFGYMPKARVKNKVSKHQKVKKHKKHHEPLTLTSKKVTLEQGKTDTLITIKPVLAKSTKKQVLVATQVIGFKTVTGKKNNQEKPKVLQKTIQTASKTQAKTTKRDFWDTDFGDFLEGLIMILIYTAFIVLLLWLSSIGLGWLAALILIAVGLILFLEALSVFSEVYNAIMDGLFDR